LGFENAKKCYHLAYGRVDGKDGKMSSRAGNAILFPQMKDLLVQKIKTEFLSKYENEWPQDEIEETARRITVATIKYGMLNQDNNKNIIFDLDEWSSRTGNTGPYLLYAYARIQSILRETSEIELKNIDHSSLQEEAEKKLLRQMGQFHRTVAKSTFQYEPHILCIYLFNLAKNFSTFYSQCSVLKAPTPELQKARLALVKATAELLKKGLNLLGIQTVERM